jgi:hypothetical protein
MATTNLSLPRPNMPELGLGSWPESNEPQPDYGPWRNLSVPPRYFDTPTTAVAAMPQPVQKPTRRGRRIAAWSLWVFAGGLAAGPLLADYADQGLEAAIAWLAKSAPSFVRPYLPKPLEESTPPPQASTVAPPVSPAAPAIAPARTEPARTEPASKVAAQPGGVKASGAATTAKAAEPERRIMQAKAHRPRATRKLAAALGASEPARPAESAQPKAPAKPAGRRERANPFAADEGGSIEAAPTERPAKAAAEPAAGKSSPTKSGDGLDDLMAGVTGGSPSKDRRNTSREIDAMLKDVQKSQPAPRPKRAEPAPLPSLTASDIAKAMAGVKTGARACGRRFGQNGVVDLRLAVGKDGKVTDVALRGKLAELPISECITRAARGAAFPPNSGLKFDYRIDVQ